MLDRAPIYRSYSRLLSIAPAFLAVGLTCSDVAHASSDRFATVAIEDGGQRETLSGAEADSHVSGDISGSERGSSDGERASGAEQWLLRRDYVWLGKRPLGRRSLHRL